MFEWLFGYSYLTYQKAGWAFDSVWPLWLFCALLFVASFCIFLFLSRVRGSMGSARIATIGILQCLMVGLVLTLLWQPSLVVERLKPNQNAIALMLDVSESMAYGLEGAPRIDSAKDLLASQSITDLESIYPVDRFVFAGETTLVDDFDALPAPGAETKISSSLVEVLERAKTKSMAALVLVSDGAESAQPLTPDQLAEIAAYGVPVHTVGVGREQIAEDIELERIVVPDRVLPNTVVTAEISIRHDAAGIARLKVYSEEEFLASKEVSLGDLSANTNVQIEFDLGDSGFKELRFQLDAIEGEINLANNQRSHMVEVADQQYSVLYVEGEPRWEYKFIRRALASDPTIDLMTLLWVSNNKFYRQGINSPSDLATGFPDSRETLFDFDAIIIGSIEAPRLSADQQSLIREFVSERGGSLLMLGGRFGLSDGNWGNTPIEDLLPVRLKGLESSFVNEPAQVGLTHHGLDSAFLTLEDDPELNQTQWQALPAIDSYQKLGSLRPAASTLLELTPESSREALPLLVTQPYGKGQSFILATGGTWRWQMNLPSEDLSHQTFWRQLVRALVVNSPEKMTFDVETQGDELKLVAEVRDERYQPVDDVRVVAVMSSDDENFGAANVGLELIAAAGVPGRYEARVKAEQTGTYFVDAIASRDDEPLDAVRVAVHQGNSESESFGIRQDRAQLERIAEVTGGRYWSADSLRELPQAIENSSAGIIEQVRYPLWGIPAVFLCLIFIKVAEWLLRRRWGLI